MSTKEYESAFPVPEARGADDRLHQPNYTGMSLRDYFAAKAMAALVSLPSRVETSLDDDAYAAYAMADAMLAVRNGGAK